MLTQPGVYPVQLSVSDGKDTTFADVVHVSVGIKPVITVTSPAQNNTLFRAGDTLTFAATATVGAALAWSIVLFHDNHVHPVVTGAAGGTYQLQVPTQGHPFHDDTYYVATCKATSPAGLVSQVVMVAKPQEVMFTLKTEPPGIGINVDGISTRTPVALDSMIGFVHHVQALETLCVDGAQYTFQQWSTQATSTTLDITVPDTDLQLTAHYTSGAACNQVRKKMNMKMKRK